MNVADYVYPFIFAGVVDFFHYHRLDGNYDPYFGRQYLSERAGGSVPKPLLTNKNLNITLSHSCQKWL